MKALDAAQLYFRVTYEDSGLIFPHIEVFVYLGHNLSDEDDDLYYFQPSSDFHEFGSAIAEGAKYRPVVCQPGETVGEMLDAKGLQLAMEACSSRLRKSGLRKAT